MLEKVSICIFTIPQQIWTFRNIDLECSVCLGREGRVWNIALCSTKTVGCWLREFSGLTSTNIYLPAVPDEWFHCLSWLVCDEILAGNRRKQTAVWFRKTFHVNYDCWFCLWEIYWLESILAGFPLLLIPIVDCLNILYYNWSPTFDFWGIHDNVCALCSDFAICWISSPLSIPIHLLITRKFI